MQCEHWDRGACRSCRYLDVPYGEQVAAKSETAAEALALVPTAAGVHWLSPRRSAPTAFRTSAKLVVGGTRRRPTLGILGPDRRGVDLPGCPIQHPAINRATPALKRFIRSLDLIPYDVPTKNGELKYILLTVGADEIILSKRRMLPIRAGDLDLALGPGSFIQTNAAVAGDLYRQAADWAALPLASGDAPQTLWDLYCGIGGFALHTANAGIPRVTGVEVSERAIASAIRSASQAGLSPHRCALHRSGCNRVGCSARPRHGARRPHRQSAQARDRGRPRPVGQRARRRARHLLVVQSDKPRPGSGGHARLPVRRSAPIRHVPPYRPRRGRGAVAPHPLLSRAAAARRPRPPLHESRSLSRRMRSHCARRSRTACSYPLSVGS